MKLATRRTDCSSSSAFPFHLRITKNPRIIASIRTYVLPQAKKISFISNPNGKSFAFQGKYTTQNAQFQYFFSPPLLHYSTVISNQNAKQVSPSKNSDNVKVLEEWSEEDVQKWFLSTKYAEYANRFAKLDGKEMAGLKEPQFQKELGNLQGSALYNAVQLLKKRERFEIQTISDLEKFLASTGIELKPHHTKEEYDSWNKPSENPQKIVLGPVFKHTWPIITPILKEKESDKESDKEFDFLYSTDTNIGRDAVELVASLIASPATLKILINLGLSGAGKSHLIRQLAVRGKANVLLYDCSTNASLIDQIIRDLQGHFQINKQTDVETFVEFSRHVQYGMLKFTLANALVYLYLLKNYKMTPVQFLRYMENGGVIVLKQVFDIINQHFAEMENFRVQLLKDLIVEQIKHLTNLPVVEAWDEAGLLAEWAADQIPFTKDSGKLNLRSEYDPESKRCKNAGSAFTLAVRIANESQNSAIFCGTALRLGSIEAHISKQLKGLIKKTTDDLFKERNVLKMWSEAEVLKSLQEDMNIQELDLNLDSVTYLLQGRPRLTTLFKTKVYAEMKKNPDLPVQAIFDKALQVTEAQAAEEFRAAVNKFRLGTTETSRITNERAQKREELIEELVIKGHIEFKDDHTEYDLVAHGIVHIEKFEETKVQYASLEPLMYWAMYQYLEQKGVKFEDILLEWMQDILTDYNHSNYKIQRKAQSAKGFSTEVLLAHVLTWITKDLEGKPITNHELFAELQGTYLEDYTLEFKSFQHDSDHLWKDILRRKRTDILVLPPQKMRPDIFGLLKCIKGSPSHQSRGDHTIPLTLGSKMHSQSLQSAYLDNVRSTNIREIFTKNGKPIEGAEKDREEAIQLVNQAFGNDGRALQISFLYNPFKSDKTRSKFGQKVKHLVPEEAIHIKFDFHHKPFEKSLKKYKPEAEAFLQKFVGQSSTLS